MSTSETDSEPESIATTDAVSSLTAFAHLSATRPDESGSQPTVSWAVDTLAALDFRLVRKDAALHGLIQTCASTILALFNALIQQGPAIGSACQFIADTARILRPAFLDLLFQYRRLFRVIAARKFKSSPTLLAIVCWVDVVLAKLGDVTALVAAGLVGEHPDHSLPESLRAQREEDNLRAAMQLPDQWDMLPSMLLSERVSAAAKRLSIRLMLGRYILCPALSGQPGVDNLNPSVICEASKREISNHVTLVSIHQLLPTFAEWVRQSAARVDELRSALGPSLRYVLEQERFTSAMAISLFAAADMAHASTVVPQHVAAFRPQTMAAAMQLLRFVMKEGGHTTQMNVLNPPDHLDIPTSVILRWGIVPQWTWSIWGEYSSLHADTIMCVTTTYIRHHSADSGSLLDVSDLMTADSGSSDQAAVIGVIIDLLFRFISVLCAGVYSKQLSAGMMSVLHGSCRLISQWINRNSCGIRRSEECCKALIILFGHLSQNEQHLVLSELVVECLALMKGRCTREAWRSATDDSRFRFLEALSQSFIQARTLLSQNDLPRSRDICAAQMMQFHVVMMSKGVRPFELDACVDLIEAVVERVLETPLNDREFLCETLLICLATANLSEIELPFGKASLAVDDEILWHLGMCSGSMNLFLASAFSLYITSTPVSVEPLTYLEGLEHILDVILLIISRHYPREDEPLALIVLPTMCDALAHLLEHSDDVTGTYALENSRMTALANVLESLGDDDSGGDQYESLLRRRLRSVAGRVLRQMEREERMAYELVCCRHDGLSRVLYVRDV